VHPPDVSIEGRGGVAPERENLEAVFETFFPLLILRIQDICDID
jgi:hypothetical protein